MSESYTIPVPVAAGGAIARGTCLKISTGTLVVTTAATETVVAIAQDTYASGAQATGVVSGPCYALASGAITAFSLLQAGANGKVIAHDGTAANTVVGIAWQAAAADGDLILIHKCPPGVFEGI